MDRGEKTEVWPKCPRLPGCRIDTLDHLPGTVGHAGAAQTIGPAVLETETSLTSSIPTTGCKTLEMCLNLKRVFFCIQRN